MRTPTRPEQVADRVRQLRQGDNMAEALLWLELKDRKLGGYKFVRQFPIGPYFADFLCRSLRLVVEIDGGQHADSAYDRKRDAFMNAAGYSVIRFWNIDVLKRMDEVCDTILAALQGRFSENVSSPDLRFTQGREARRLAPDANPPPLTVALRAPPLPNGERNPR